MKLTPHNLKVFQYETEKSNSKLERPIRRGDEVIDFFGNKGIVVKIKKATTDYHGCITVWQSEKENYGAQNCEHYVYEGWQRDLRILSSFVNSEEE